MRGIRSVVLAALSGLAFVGLGASARGDIVTLTFTGTVSSSSDPAGTFGCTTGPAGTCNTDNPGGPYLGDTYTAVFTFNTGVGTTGDYPGFVVFALGGSSAGGAPPSPLVGDAIVTVNGVQYDLPGTFYASLQSRSSPVGGLPNEILVNVNDANGNGIYATVSTFSTTPPSSPQFPVSITTPFSDNFGGNASSILSFDCSLPVCQGIEGDMSVSLTISVPEPSTWIMMAVAFAGVGLGGYRRARAATA
jgi:hypothetical protein